MTTNLKCTVASAFYGLEKNFCGLFGSIQGFAESLPEPWRPKNQDFPYLEVVCIVESGSQNNRSGPQQYTALSWVGVN